MTMEMPPRSIVSSSVQSMAPSAVLNTGAPVASVCQFPTWNGVIAPAAVPRPIIDKLNAAINRAIASQTFKDRFAMIGDEPAGGTPEEFGELIRKDSAKWGEVVRRAGARLD